MKTTLHNLKKSIQIEQDSAKKGILLIKLAERCYDLKKYKRAIIHYKKAIKHSISPRRLGVCYDMLGSLHQELKDYKKSVYYNKLAFRKPQPKNRKAAILTNIGRMYFNVYHRDDIAFNFFQKALQLFSSKLNYFDKDSLSHCHYCLGVIRQEKGDLSRARYHYKKTLYISKMNSDNSKKARENLRIISQIKKGYR